MSPCRPSMWRLLNGGRLGELHGVERSAREARAAARARAHESLARHDTRPHPVPVDVLPADKPLEGS